jgi:hypothetical protein
MFPQLPNIQISSNASWDVWEKFAHHYCILDSCSQLLFYRGLKNLVAAVGHHLITAWFISLSRNEAWFRILAFFILDPLCEHSLHRSVQPQRRKYSTCSCHQSEYKLYSTNSASIYRWLNGRIDQLQMSVNVQVGNFVPKNWPNSNNQNNRM